MRRVLHPSRQVSKDRRKYLHNEIDSLNARDLGYRLLHDSRGDGRQRTLVVKKVAQNDIEIPATPARAMTAGLDFLLPSGMSSACAAIPSGPGHKLGGRLSTDGKREASAMAAERRMSAASLRGVKKPRISLTPQGTPQAQAPQTRTPAGAAAAPMPEEDGCSSSSSSSSETDEEMRKALQLSLQDVPASRTSTTRQEDEEKDLQEALRLSLESAASQDAPSPISPARFPRQLASKSVLVAKKAWKKGSGVPNSCKPKGSSQTLRPPPPHPTSESYVFSLVRRHVGFLLWPATG